MRSPSARHNQRGLTLIELIVAFTVLLVLTTLALPLARARLRANRENELRHSLTEVRKAIDYYKDLCDAKRLGPQKADTNCYPESLEQLVKGVKLPDAAGTQVRFLRRIPRDPMTGTYEWGMRSDRDDPKSTSWGGQCLFDIYTKNTDKGSDGAPYSEW
ncbi:MAG: prepilin-type N-terminal cleavage/methylation domain-containing protein [Acidobacteriia bacterium]|nr:prepilin-type N-terminal cleavage/methylation domain-containing protein [Terriglobia bacterium]